MFNAIVIGGTGATGRRIIEQLLAHEKCKTVTAIGRRRSNLPGRGGTRIRADVSTQRTPHHHFRPFGAFEWN